MLSDKSIKRIQREIKQFQDDPPDYITKIYVNENNLTHVYFLLNGPKDSPYENGEYIIHMKLPNTYPHDPPSIEIKTPNGRFIINKNICTTFTNYHPESWSSVYTFSTIMKSFLSFMIDDDSNHVGGMNSSIEDKKKYALNSKEYNLKNLSKIIFQ